MNTTLSIRIENDLKQSFLSKTKEKGLDGARIIRYFIEKFNSNPDIIKFEIDDNIFDEILKNESIVSKLEKISDKLDSI